MRRAVKGERSVPHGWKRDGSPVTRRALHRSPFTLHLGYFGLVCMLITGALAAQADPSAAALTVGRLHYEGGGDWYANPSSLPNLLHAIGERTDLQVAVREKVVQLGDDDVWNIPYLYMTGHGNVRFSDKDLETLRRFLLAGGFLHADDNYGMDESIRRELARLFPDRPLVEVPLDHPIYHLIYDFPKGLPKIHEHDGKPAQGFGIFIDGRLAVYYTYQCDLGDGWEDFEVHRDPPEKHEAALRMGVNLFAYAVGFGGTR
jgi:uncharacterized protein DUF4159